MPPYEKILQEAMSGTKDRNIRFTELQKWERYKNV